MHTNQTQTRSRARKVAEARVSWAALSARLDLTDRAEHHSGRPSVEQVPKIEVEKLKKSGAEKGALLHLKSLDGPIEVVCFVRAIFRGADGGEFTVAWEYTRDVGEPEARTIKVQLRVKPTPCGVQYRCDCPHCGEGARHLFYAVHTWACKTCLTIKPESMRGRSIYTSEKAVRMLRKKLGGDDRPLAPIVLGTTSKKKRELARRVHEAEMALMAKLAGGG